MKLAEYPRKQSISRVDGMVKNSIDKMQKWTGKRPESITLFAQDFDILDTAERLNQYGVQLVRGEPRGKR